MPGAASSNEIAEGNMAKKDKGHEKVNVATSGYTPVQAGRVVGDKKAAEKARKAVENARQAIEQDTTNGTVRNITTGNARVGCQADVIVGDLHIRM
jgi:hypothetical protein